MLRLGAWASRNCPCLACVTRRAGVPLEPQAWARWIANHYDATELADAYALADVSMLPR